jgi:hypothetical protein
VVENASVAGKKTLTRISGRDKYVLGIDRLQIKCEQRVIEGNGLNYGSTDPSVPVAIVVKAQQFVPTNDRYLFEQPVDRSIERVPL